MRGEQDSESAHADRIREKAIQAFKRTLEQAGGDRKKALSLFQREAEADRDILEHVFSWVYQDVISKRPELADDPWSIPAEVHRIVSDRRGRSKKVAKGR